MFYVYILQSQSTGKYYVGSTQDVNNRLHEHDQGESLSTRAGRPWESVHVEEFQTRSEAVRKENQIKARGISRYLQSLDQLAT